MQRLRARHLHHLRLQSLGQRRLMRAAQVLSRHRRVLQPRRRLGLYELARVWLPLRLTRVAVLALPAHVLKLLH